MKNKVEYLIVGGGINGLFVGYHLASRGIHDIMVIEKKYPASGATGRCAGGSRAQWGTIENITLVKNSLSIWKKLTDEIGFNIWFRQGGYLLLGHNEKHEQLLRKAVELQRKVGWKTKLIGVDEVKKIAPWINPYDVRIAAYNPKDGIIFPYAPAWGLWMYLRNLDIEVVKGMEAKKIIVKNKKAVGVTTNRGDIYAEKIILAAGTHNRELLATVGAKWPTDRQKHEIIVTLPYEFFHNPLVISFKHSFYMTQAMRGELVLGVGKIEGDPSNLFPSSNYLYEVARSMVDLMPGLRKVKIMRHWAGYYDVAPDGKPIASEVKEAENLYVVGAGSGHGFMAAPYLTKLFVDYLMRGKKEFPLNKLSLYRFQREKLEPEPFVIG